ncbi:hypothetical protein [Streptomyces syringium]|uniref:hypothetical protein n=1 Tax=Streptomyces syringium TaxID=76729 RepID=UPI003F51898C
MGATFRHGGRRRAPGGAVGGTSLPEKGLGVGWNPPADLCDRVLDRLFPDAPVDTDRWRTLLWATGRAELPGLPRVTPPWQWPGAPLSAEGA